LPWQAYFAKKGGALMKKGGVTLFYMTFLCVCVTSLYGQPYTTNQLSNIIHVVYDDSGSMIEDGGVYFDRWGQAKYAMEVFAALLEENDVMRVYYMSDFTVARGVDAPARILIRGSESAGERVAKIHNTVTSSSDTPFDAVAKAYADLQNADSPEQMKWLVVLTDGQFNRLNGQITSDLDVDSFYSRYVRESSVQIIHLAMGDDAAVIRADPGRHIYFEHARNSSEILGKITSICNQIFNRNSLKFTDENRREFSFDVPMLELFVFAQGPDVKVNGISGADRHAPGETVNVRYSEVAATNFRGNPNVIISRNLTGVVAVFKDIAKGRYSLDLAGAQTVEIYYKPSVNVVIRLYQGRRAMSDQEIPADRYRIWYGLVDGDGNETKSSLLGNVNYEATLENNGQTIPVKSGDIINIQQGEVTIRVQSYFLEINTSENSLTRTVYYVPFTEKFIFKFIILPLSILLLVIFLWWFLWGRKKRFPKYMSSKPAIEVERDGNIVTKFGSFKIIPKTKWLPLCPERGTIVAVADGQPLPSLKVRATGGEQMEIINAGDFSADRLNGVDFSINGKSMSEGPGKSKKKSCSAQIVSIFYSAGSATTYTCFLAKKHMKRRK
jgi:hypothetical protein